MPVALQCAYLLDPNLLVRRCLHPTDWSDLTTSISQHSPGVAARTRPHMLHIYEVSITNTAVYSCASSCSRQEAEEANVWTIEHLS